ncbi:MAG: hypothetical protein FWE24_07205 [Defluviitaleaceae bacterium]|nr:hypothetical protein [Defluviitaleaceae bacterium]
MQGARRAIVSLIGKCEKSYEKLNEGTAQHSLMHSRLKALRIALYLIDKELKD